MPLNRDVQSWFADPEFQALSTADKERTLGSFFDSKFGGQLEQFPEEERPALRSNFIEDNLAPHRPAAPSRGWLSDIGVAAARAVPTAAETGLRAVAGVQEFMGETSPGAREVARDVAGWREDVLPTSKEASEPGWRRDVTSGIESAGSSLLLTAPAMGLGAAVATGGATARLAGALAGRLAFGPPMFAAAQYDQAIEKYRKKGVAEDEAQRAALIEAAAEGGFEYLSDALELATLGWGTGLTRPLKEAAAAGVKKVVASSWKESLKRGAMVYGAETVPELLTTGVQQEAEAGVGASKETFWDAVTDQFGAISVASLIFAGLGAAGHKYATGKNLKLLKDPSADPQERLSAVHAIAGELARGDQAMAQRWRDGATIAILQGKPIAENIRDDIPTAPEASAPVGAGGEGIAETARTPEPVATITGKRKKDIAAGKPLPQESPAQEPPAQEPLPQEPLPQEAPPPPVQEMPPAVVAPVAAPPPVTPQEVAEVAPPAAPSPAATITGRVRPVDDIAAGKPLPQQNAPPPQKPTAPEAPQSTIAPPAMPKAAGKPAVSAPIERAGEVLKHFTTPERAAGIRKEGFRSEANPPLFGTGSMDQGPKVGRFAGDALYLSRDDATWGKYRELDATGEPRPATEKDTHDDGEIFFSYKDQKWMIRPGKWRDVPLEAVEFQLAPDAKVLEISSSADLNAATGAYGYWDSPDFWQAIAKDYDAVSIGQTGDFKESEERGAKFFQAAMGDQVIVFNRGKVKPVAAKTPAAAATLTGRGKPNKGAWFIDADDKPVFFGAGWTVDQVSGMRGPYTEKEAQSLVGYEAVDAAKAPAGEKDVAAGTPLPQEAVAEPPSSPANEAPAAADVATATITGRKPKAAPVEATPATEAIEAEAATPPSADETIEPAEETAPANDETINPAEEPPAPPAPEKQPVPLSEIQVEIRGYSESGAAMMVKEQADTALADNAEQIATVRRLLDCLNI